MGDTQISLEAARVNAGMTQTYVAKKMKVSSKTISSWERGFVAIRMDAFYKLCNLYGISTDYVKVPNVYDRKFES